VVGYHIGATSRRTRGSIRLRGTVPAITDTHDGCPNRERRSTNWITYNLRLRGAAKSFKQSAVTRDTFRRRVQLGTWVLVQRRFRDTMPVDRRRRLEELGFDWDPHQTEWQRGLAELEKFRAREGHCRVAQSYVQNGFPLGIWVSVQRRTGATMPTDRKRNLDELGFVWRTRK